MGNQNEYEPLIEVGRTHELSNGCKVVYLHQDEGVWAAFLDENNKLIHLSSGAFHLNEATTGEIDDIKLILSESFSAPKEEKVKTNGKSKRFNSKKDPVKLHYSTIMAETEKAILFFEEIAERQVWIPRSQIIFQEEISEGRGVIHIPVWLYKNLIKEGTLPRF